MNEFVVGENEMFPRFYEAMSVILIKCCNMDSECYNWLQQNAD